MTTESDTDGGSGDQSLPIGARLRAAREKAGLTEQQVAQSLHLNQSFVKGLEAGEFGSLGAPIFVKGHLRNYARLVKLDAAAIIADYDALGAGAPPTLSVRGAKGMSMDDHVSWGSRWAWVVLVLIVIGIGVWLYPAHNAAQKTADARLNAQSLSLPTDANPSPATVTGAAVVNHSFNQPTRHATADFASIRQSAIEANSDSASAPATAAEAAQNASGGDADKTARADAPPQAAPAAPQPGAVPSKRAAHTQSDTLPATATPETQMAGGLPLVLTMVNNSWVEVDDARGEQLYYGLAHQGQTLHVRGQPPLSVFLGNAPQVQVTVNGQPIKTTSYTRSNNTARFSIHASDDGAAYADKIVPR